MWKVFEFHVTNMEADLNLECLLSKRLLTLGTWTYVVRSVHCTTSLKLALLCGVGHINDVELCTCVCILSSGVSAAIHLIVECL